MKSQSKDGKRLRGSCLCWSVPVRWSRFYARHLTNYVRMTLELETSNEIPRRPRQSHWFCDYTFLPRVVHWHELWLVETIPLKERNFALGNGFSLTPWCCSYIRLSSSVDGNDFHVKHIIYTQTIKAIKVISGFLVMQSVCSCKENILCW